MQVNIPLISTMYHKNITYRNMASKAACIFYASEPVYYNSDFFTLSNNSLTCNSSDTYNVFILSSPRMITYTQSEGYGIQELYKNGSVACSVTSMVVATNSYDLKEITLSKGDVLTAATTSGQHGVVMLFK